MKKLKLEMLIENLFNYFGYEKKISTAKINVWLEDLNMIPDEAATFIYEELKQNDSIPRNLPKAIKGIYFNWKNNNPGKFVFERESCEYCHGEGVLVFTKGNYDFQCRCGHCQNWRSVMGENTCMIYTVNEILNMGAKMYKPTIPR